MKVTVIGKEHIQGKSRNTGREFDSNVIHVAYAKNGVEGQTVESIWLNPVNFPLKAIELGGAYIVDRDSRGFILDFVKA